MDDSLGMRIVPANDGGVAVVPGWLPGDKAEVHDHGVVYVGYSYIARFNSYNDVWTDARYDAIDRLGLSPGHPEVTSKAQEFILSPSWWQR